MHHPWIFPLLLPISNQFLGHVDFPTLYFLTHPLFFILISPVFFQAPITAVTISCSIKISCLSGWPLSSQFLLPIHLLLDGNINGLTDF